MVTTLHGAAWNTEIAAALREHRHRPFVSLSDHERTFAPDLNYVGTVGNGVKVEDFPIGPGSGGYLIFAGRLAPEKAPHLAVEVARRAGMPLRVAGPIESRHQKYAEEVLGQGEVEYLGDLARGELARAVGDASVLLMPLAWDEPFGLVVIESMLCGTPVIAWRRGAMPEIVQAGVTGFLVDNVHEAVRSLGDTMALSRHRCADIASRRFNSDAMAEGYAEVYATVMSHRASPFRSPSTSGTPSP